MTRYTRTKVFASDVIYDNSNGGLNSSNVQDAITELSSIGAFGELSYRRGAFTTNGVTTSFLTPEAFAANSMIIFYNGVKATPGEEYDEKVGLDGVDFASAPASDDVVEYVYAHGVSSGITFIRQILVTDGVETAFSTASKFLRRSLVLFINGVFATIGQEYSERATLDGIDFSTAPVADDTVEVVYAIVSSVGFKRNELDTDGSTVSFDFGSTFADGSLLVFINGVFATNGYEYNENITLDGVVFTTAPATDDTVEVVYVEIS